ncbi:restriction endonuclease subunit S domain-containing protein [Streptomyces anandii]|uniref:restriction endonuclease subunit S n=1 Tax=Streptomyces anandii TaxID=285454 RepID=UPI00367D17BE
MSAESEVSWVPVGEIGEVRMGKQLSPASSHADGQVPYLRVANVFEGRIDYSDVKSMGFTDTEKRIYGLRDGDILLNEGQESLANVGRSAIYRGESEAFCFQNTLIRFRAGNMVLPEYAQEVFVQWRRQGIFAGVAEKTSISHLGGSRFAKMLFPLVPVSRQRRIVEKMAAVAEYRRVGAEIIAKLYWLRDSFLSRLMGGDCATLADVIEEGPQNGLYKAAESYGETGLPIVRINSFSGGPSDFTSGLLRVAVTSGEARRYALYVGDLLINRVNTPGLVGRSTVVTQIHEPTLFESNIMRCKIATDKMHPEFLGAWMSTAAVKRYFASRTKPAVSQASINRSDVYSCPVPELSLSEQFTFLSQLRVIDSMIAEEEASLSKLHLVGQGIADDSFSDLLRAA